NPPYAALMGDPSGWRGNERNGVWRNFLGPPGRVRHTPESRRALEAALVADLRSAVARYPADPRPRWLVAELRAKSERFAELWDSGAVGHHEAARKDRRPPPRRSAYSRLRRAHRRRQRPTHHDLHRRTPHRGRRTPRPGHRARHPVPRRLTGRWRLVEPAGRPEHGAELVQSAGAVFGSVSTGTTSSRTSGKWQAAKCPSR